MKNLLTLLVARVWNNRNFSSISSECYLHLLSGVPPLVVVVECLQGGADCIINTIYSLLCVFWIQQTLFISISFISTSVTSGSDSIPWCPGPSSSSSPSLSPVSLISSSSRSMGDWQGELPREAAGELDTTLL